MTKKFISLFIIVLCLIIALTGCLGNEPQNDTNTNSKDNQTTSKPIESKPSTSTDSKPESKPESSVTDDTPSTPETEAVPISVKIGPYEIYDIHNARGLDTKKYGFSYGVAKDGKPHNVSVNNQKKFDGMNNIDALALDTKSNDKRMYLTFDCGYEYMNLTADILDTLKEKNVKAAFFVTLDYLKKNPTLVQRMIDEGHIVGNHSATHPSFPTISREKMASELWRVEDYLKTNFDYSSKYFRFPAGEHSESALELVTSMGYTSVFWSLAHADWDTANQPTTQNAVNTVTSRYHDGAVILLHAVSQANTDGLEEMIDIAFNQGYIFKTLDEYKNQ